MSQSYPQSQPPPPQQQQQQPSLQPSQQPPPPQPPLIVDSNERWVPQPSTNQYEQPRIIDFGPLQGHTGDNFMINVCNLKLIDPNQLKIAFDSCITTCHFTLHAATQVFSIQTIVPNCELSRVPIYLLVQQAEQILDSWFIGYFTFINSRKRSSDTSLEDSAKRPRQQVVEQPPPSFTNYPPSNYYGLTSHAPYVGLPPTQPSPRQRDYYEENPMLGYPSTAYRAQDSTNFQPSFDDGTFISSATPSAPILAPQPPQPPPPSQQQQQDPYIMPLMETIHHPPSILTPATTTTTNTTTTDNTNTNTTNTTSPPNLQIKPSLPLPLQQSTYPITATTTTTTTTPSTTTTTTTASNANSAMLTSDPFANLLNKANLVFEGDLETMTKDWTPEEWENGRRLVQFWRRQEGNEVTSRFEPFQMPTDKSKDISKLIIVSCIYYKEKNDYYVTSVDCIYLLEHLIGVKFTVEEKNRIRRNLEGYKPLTVSKLKPESAEFFKLIMGFPNPKPRNIEKDVKVFPWSILGVALKKIISKYTASYSSTASVNYDVLTSPN